MKTLWYMGVKTRLIDGFIDRAIERCAPEGATLLDIFSGTAVVATALASRYRVVTNDVQRYAAAVARAYLVHDEKTKNAFLASLHPAKDLGKAFSRNYRALAKPLARALAIEDAFLREAGFEPAELTDEREALPEPTTRSTGSRGKKDLGTDAYRKLALEGTPLFDEVNEPPFPPPFESARELLSRGQVLARRAEPRRFPYILCSAYYPNVYLGIRQAIATDSLRYAIDEIDARDPFAEKKRAHYLGALLHALSVTTSATSHFCQPRGLTNDGEVERVLARRAPSIASRMLAFSNDIAGTIRTTCFHEGNAVCAGDWRAIFSSKGSGREAWRRPEARADVVYIDPPYTADHYSRFYHLLEVVTDYDYPALEVRRNRVTKGRYPVGERRHHSAFCRRETVEGEFRDVLRSCSRAGAAAVVSYSRESGLLLRHYREDLGLSSEQALARFRGLALESYGDVEILERPLQHSGQGDSNIDITELLLVCRKPRKASEAAEAGGARAGRSRA